MSDTGMKVGLRDRIKLAWTALTNLKGLATMVPTFMRGAPLWGDTNLYSLVKGKYTKNELMWRCMNVRAQAASAPRLKVYSKETGEELPDHPLAKLINRPNHMMSQYDLWMISIIYSDLTGWAHWEQIRSGAGNTVELWPLRPDRMKPIPDPVQVISGYQYMVPGLEPMHIDARNVISYRVFDPLSMYTAIAPAAVASRVTDVDVSQTDYLKKFFQSGGMPPGLIKTKKKLIDTDVTDIRRRWRERYGGYEKWMDPAVLDLDAEYQKIGFSFEEMGMDALDSRSEIRVCMAFMVPPILVGARVGLERATYANYREARTSFMEDIMEPLLGHMRDTFQRELADEEWGDVELKWDFSRVPVLFQKNLDQRVQHRADYLAGGLLLDEYRRYMELPPLPNNTGRVRVQSLAFQIIPEGDYGQLVPLKQPAGVGDTKRRKLSDIIAESVEAKSPACRQKGETVQECVSRKIPEIHEEHPDWDDDQVEAVAYSMCEKPCKSSGNSRERKEGEGPLPANTERDALVATGTALIKDALEKQSERIVDAATG